MPGFIWKGPHRRVLETYPRSVMLLSQVDNLNLHNAFRSVLSCRDQDARILVTAVIPWNAPQA